MPCLTNGTPRNHAPGSPCQQADTVAVDSGIIQDIKMSASSSRASISTVEVGSSQRSSTTFQEAKIRSGNGGSGAREGWGAQHRYRRHRHVAFDREVETLSIAGRADPYAPGLWEWLGRGEMGVANQDFGLEDLISMMKGRGVPENNNVDIHFSRRKLLLRGELGECAATMSQ